MSSYDVAIVGGGMVGLTLALLLAQHTSLQIALIDAKPLSQTWNGAQKASRVSAISLASQRLFERLGVWEGIKAKRISPYRKMHVWDAGSHGVLQFDSAMIHRDVLGYIVEDQVMRASLFERLAQYSSVHCLSPITLQSWNESSHGVELHAEEDVIHAKLLVAADGGNSWVREQAGIPFDSHDYAHTALVATVQTHEPHQCTAWQRFLANGVLAFLPLQDERTCSIVWSTTPDEATRLMTLSDEAFCSALAEAFDFQLGKVISVGPRQVFPLVRRHAKQYVKSRLALVGDAAHTIHPLAGQGVNLGLLDAAALYEVIHEAVQKRRNYASFATLRRFERWRKGDNAVMMAFVGLIKQIFGQKNQAAKVMRDTGLNITNQWQALKTCCIQYAVGNRVDLPALCRE